MRVPVNPDGSAGTPSLVHGPYCAALLGADGLAVDAGGALIVTLNLQNRLVRIEPGGAIQSLATADDGLDFPASVAVTPGGFVVANYALLAFLDNASPRPSLLIIDRR